MNQWQRLSTVDQFTAHLRAALVSGHWVGTMPGELRLAEEFAINRKTVKAALRILENEGLLVNQGRGAQRRIMRPKNHAPPRLRVAILCHEQSDQSLDYLIDCKNKLEEAGHTTFFAPSNLTEIKMDVRRLARVVRKTEADAWVVVAATRKVLEWFVQQKISAFALFGRRRQLKIGGIGPDNIPAFVEVTRRLIELGHQRIVFLDSLFHISEPGIAGGTFLDELTAHGIAVSSYNMPSWQGGHESLYTLLDSSFIRTPPTAIIIGSDLTYFATLHFLLNQGIRVPQDLSLVCLSDNPFFSQCQPSVSHIRWSSRSVVKSIVRWARNISEGKVDTRQTSIKSEFVEGGTIGPVAKNVE